MEDDHRRLGFNLNLVRKHKLDAGEIEDVIASAEEEDDLAGLQDLANLDAAVPADPEGGLDDGGLGDLAGLGASIPADFGGGLDDGDSGDLADFGAAIPADFGGELDDGGPGDLEGLGGMVSSDVASVKDMGDLDIHIPGNQNEKDKKEAEITSKKGNTTPEDKK